jgi:hypothetical protein
MRYLEATICRISSWMASNLLFSSFEEWIPFHWSAWKFFWHIFHISSNTSKSRVPNIRNFDIIFDSIMSMSDHISTLRESSLSSICDTRRIRSCVDHVQYSRYYRYNSLNHFGLDDYNSFLIFLPLNLVIFCSFQMHLLGLSPCRTPKLSHISPVLRYVPWLEINERFQFNASFTYQILQTNEKVYFRNSTSNQRENREDGRRRSHQIWSVGGNKREGTRGIIRDWELSPGYSDPVYPLYSACLNHSLRFRCYQYENLVSVSDRDIIFYLWRHPAAKLLPVHIKMSEICEILISSDR